MKRITVEIKDDEKFIGYYTINNKYGINEYHPCKEVSSSKAEQESKTGHWIPVNERLPEERDWYLAVFREKDTAYQLIPRVADYIGNGENKWRIIDEEELCHEYYRDMLECIAWMPLPTPYEPQESESKRYIELAKSYVQGLREGLAESEE